MPDLHSETRAKTLYVNAEGGSKPLALMSRTEAVAAVQELQLRMMSGGGLSGLCPIDHSSVKTARLHADAMRGALYDPVSDTRVRFTPSQFRMVEALVLARGTVLLTSRLISVMLGHRDEKDDANLDNTVKVQICKIRKSLREGGMPLDLRNCWGMGYSLHVVDPVEASGAPA